MTSTSSGGASIITLEFSLNESIDIAQLAVIGKRADEALYVAKRSGRNRAAPREPAATEAQAGLQWLGRRPRHPSVRNVTPAKAVG